MGARTGNGKVSSVNAAYGANTGRTKIKQTVLSSLSGKEVDINVGNNTNIKGALIAAGEFDKTGNFIDSKNMKFKTNTITFANNTNSTFSSNTGFNVGTSVQASIDHRMFTEEGREEIKKDFVDSKNHMQEIGQAIADVVTTDKTIGDLQSQVLKYQSDREDVLSKKAAQEETQEKLKGEKGALASKDEIQNISDELSQKDNLKENTNVSLYDGTQTLDDTKISSQNEFNKELSSAGYESKSNSMLINTDKTDMTNSIEVIKATVWEQERHTQAQNGDTNTLSEDSQTALAKARSDRAATVWNDYSGLAGIETKSSAFQVNWNNTNRNSATIISGNNKVNDVKSEEVKPFIPAVVVGLVAAANYLNAPKDEEEIKSGPTDAAYLIPGTAIPKALSTLGLKTVAKGSAVTLGISTGIDLTAQGINKIVTGEDINYDNLKTTAIMSLTGNAAANVVNSGKNISNTARVLYGLGTDTVVSTSSQYIKTGKVEAENVFVDVVVGKSFEKIGSTAGMLYKKTTKSIKHIDNKIIPTLKKQSNEKSKTIHERNKVRAKINKTEQKKQNVITNSGFKTGALVNNSGTTIANSIADSDDKKEDTNDK